MTGPELAAFLKARIRTVPDWPKKGVNFRDVTSLFQDPDAFQAIVEAFADDCGRCGADIVAAVDARGFIVGGALAYRLGLPFVLVRKKGKLPFKTLAEDYALEYGTGTVEIHADACRPGSRVLITDPAGDDQAVQGAGWGGGGDRRGDRPARARRVPQAARRGAERQRPL